MTFPAAPGGPQGYEPWRTAPLGASCGPVAPLCTPASQRGHLALSLCHVVNTRVIVPGHRNLSLIVLSPRGFRLELICSRGIVSSFCCQ